MEGIEPAVTAGSIERPRVEGRALRPVATAAFVVLAIIGLGKVAGFAREIVVVSRFGASAATDGFFTAYALFNVVWVMALATSLAPVVVPSLARIEVSGDLAHRRRTAGLYAGAGLALAALLALLSFVLADAIIGIAGRDLSTEATRAAASSLRLLSVAIVPIVLAGVLGAILQAHDRFAAAASSTLIVSTSMVVFTLGLGGWGIEAVSVGVLVGAVLQLVVLVPDLLAISPLARPRRVDLAGTAATGGRVVPVSGLAGLVALRPVLERSFAAELGTGLVTLVGLGSRTGSFFASLVGTGLSTAVFPRLSRAAARNDEAALAATVRFAASFMVITSLPVAAAILFLSGDAAVLLFRHGSVTDEDARRLAIAMTAYAPAILLAPYVDVLARIRYARADVATPLLATGLGLLLNGVLLAGGAGLGLPLFGLSFGLNVIVMVAILGWRERQLGTALLPGPRALVAAIAGSVAALAIYLLTREGLVGLGEPVAILLGFAAAGVVYTAVVGAAFLPPDRWTRQPR